MLGGGRLGGRGGGCWVVVERVLGGGRVGGRGGGCWGD